MATWPCGSIGPVRTSEAMPRMGMGAIRPAGASAAGGAPRLRALVRSDLQAARGDFRLRRGDDLVVVSHHIHGVVLQQVLGDDRRALRAGAPLAAGGAGLRGLGGLLPLLAGRCEEIGPLALLL